MVIPGCPETFQSFEQSQRRGRREDPREEQTSVDQHQKIRRFRQGDVIALPAGVAHWCYNNGETPVVAVTVFDIANHANQLDRSPRVSTKTSARASANISDDGCVVSANRDRSWLEGSRAKAGPRRRDPAAGTSSKASTTRSSASHWESAEK